MLVVILLILLLSIITKNYPLLLASIVVFILSQFNVTEKMQKNIKSISLLLGLFFISIYILIPIIQNKITLKNILEVSKTKIGIIGLIIGICVSILSTKGISLQSQIPEITISLILGTILGIVFFKGTASGTIVAGGLAYFVISIFKILNIIK